MPRHFKFWFPVEGYQECFVTWTDDSMSEADVARAVLDGTYDETKQYVNWDSWEGIETVEPTEDRPVTVVDGNTFFGQRELKLPPKENES